MSLLKVTTAAIFLLYLTTVKATDIKTFILDNDCDKTAIIRAGDVFSGTNSSGILSSRYTGEYPTNAECTVKIQSGSVFEGILVTIREINFYSCEDLLKVENSIGLIETYCLDISDRMETREFFSSGDMTVTLKTGGKRSNYKKFQLTFTSYRASYTGSTFCPSKGFECDNGRCISSAFKCDEQHNHCGGDSGNPKCGLSPGGVAGIVCGTIFLVIAFIAGTVYICRKKQRTMTATTTTHYPPPA